MKKLNFITILFICSLFTFKVGSVQTKSLDEGIKLYKMKKYDQSKILFERDIVFNPKSEKSYLYLAKIYNFNENDDEEEMNLNNVLLLNPLNDEAIYMLTILKIKQFDYKKAKSLIEKFDLVCKSFCSKKNEMEKKFKKLASEDDKAKN
jgi:tetratricopeptide (TPR) repeat protein